MSIKKRAVCMQKVSMGGNVFRCASCGHMSVLPKGSKDSKCPLCDGIMSSVSENDQNDQSDKVPTESQSV